MTGNPDPHQHKRPSNGKFDGQDISLPPLKRLHRFHRSSGQTKQQTTSLSLDSSELVRRKQSRSLRLSSNFAVIKSERDELSQLQTTDTGQMQAEPLPPVCEVSGKDERENQTTGGGSRSQLTEPGKELIWPIDCRDALTMYKDHLSQYEKSEIIHYGEIWFLGLEAKKVPAVRGCGHNHGYDDEYGNYHCVPHDHLAYRYEVLEVLGMGSFGQVVKAYDHKMNGMVAIKIIRNKRRFHNQAAVEISILQALRAKDKDDRYRVVHMYEFFYSRNHLCIVFELLGINLYELIKKNGYRGFSLSLVRRFAYSLLQCLKMLSRERIIHCDLKPENILLKLNGKTSVKVIDFGSSCYEYNRVYSYIQSRFYRAPEVLLGMPYTPAIDMWSLGCILCELYTGYPIFPGEDEVEQMACIVQVCGTPVPHLLAAGKKQHIFFDSKGGLLHPVNSKGVKRLPDSISLADALKTDNMLFIDFIQRCLKLDPSNRMTPVEAVQHKWIVEALKPSVAGAKAKGEVIVPQALSIERCAPIGADKEASDDPMPKQGAAIMLPPLKHVPQMKERNASTQRPSNAHELSRDQVQDMKGGELGGKSSHVVNDEGSKTGSFLPKIN